MAVFKPNLEWSTIQDKQLKALYSINDDISKMLSSTANISGELYSINENILRSADIIVSGIEAVWNGREITSILRSSQDSSRASSEILEDMSGSQEEYYEELLDSLEETRQSEEDRHLENLEVLSNLSSSLREFAGRIWDKSVEDANTYSSLYNDIIRYTGSDKSEAQKFRRDIINITSGINKDLGGISKLNPQEILNTMVAISQNTNISNQETLKALTAPIVMAQETTNLNTSELAKIGARFYTRYNFASEDLEGLVDHIRNTTEGQDVNEDDILAAIGNVETRLGIQFQGDKDSIESASESLATGISYLESMHVDANPYIEDIYKLFSTDPTDQHSLMMKYGNYEEIEEAAESGDIARAMELMLQSLSQEDTLTAKALGHDISTAEEAQLWGQQSGKTLDEFLLDISDNETTARERAADKFVSMEEQLYNKLSEATGYLATIQENLGVGLSDISLLLATTGNLRTLLGGSGGSIPGGQGLAGLLSSSGPAIGVAAAIVGVAGIVQGLVDTYKIVNKDEIEHFEKTSGNLGEVTEGNRAGYNVVISVDDEGHVTKDYELTQFSADSYNEEEQKKIARDVFNDSVAKMKSQYLVEGWDVLQFALGMGTGEGENGKHQWYDFIPGLGMAIEGIEKSSRLIGNFDNFSDTNNLISFLNGLSPEELKIYNAYKGKGLIASESQQEFFLKNFNEFVKLHNEEKAAEVSKKGLKNPVDRKALLGYAVGTNFVGDDQLAYIHKGEAITPAKYNPAANMNELERLRSEKEAKDSREMGELISVLSEIKEFMEYWKTENDKQSRLERSRNMTPQRANLLSYMTGR